MINIRRPWRDFEDDEEVIILHFEVVEDDEA